MQEHIEDQKFSELLDSYLKSRGVEAVDKIKSKLTVTKASMVEADKKEKKLAKALQKRKKILAQEEQKKEKDVKAEKAKQAEKVIVKVVKVAHVYMGSTGFGTKKTTLIKESDQVGYPDKVTRGEVESAVVDSVWNMLKAKRVSFKSTEPKTRSLLIVKYLETQPSGVIRECFAYIDVPNLTRNIKVMPATPDLFTEDTCPVVH